MEIGFVPGISGLLQSKLTEPDNCTKVYFLEIINGIFIILFIIEIIIK